MTATESQSAPVGTPEKPTSQQAQTATPEITELETAAPENLIPESFASEQFAPTAPAISNGVIEPASPVMMDNHKHDVSIVGAQPQESVEQLATAPAPQSTEVQLLAADPQTEQLLEAPAQVSNAELKYQVENPHNEQQSAASTVQSTPTFAELMRLTQLDEKSAGNILASQESRQAIAEQWIVFIEELELSQHALNMLNCCAVHSVDAQQLNLVMPEVQDVWHSQDNIDEVQASLRTRLKSSVYSLNIHLVKDTQEPLNTPMAMMQQKERNKELAAEQAIANDVDVQYFLKQMGGKIVPHSVKPLEADEPFYNE